MSSNNLLDVAVEERKEVRENAVTFVFKKEDHAKILLHNLCDMQAGDGGILTDVILTSRRKDSEEKLHSPLLAASSPKVKGLLMARSAKDSTRTIALEGLTKKTLCCLRKFIYKCEFTIDEDTLQDLHNFAVQFEIDSLAAKCEELEDRQGRIRVAPDDHEDVLSELFHMFLEKELITTIVEDHQGKIQLEAHGPLIAAASPALQEIMLQGCMSRRIRPIRLGIHANALREFIGYLYSAKVTLQRENAVGLLRAACNYQIPALAKVCCEWLIAKLEAYDVVGILCLVRELDSEYTEDLEKRARILIISNFSSFSTEDGIDKLGHEDLMEIIQDDNLEIEDEKDVYHAVIKWLEFDEKNRLPHLSRLLAYVRLEQTSVEFLASIQQDPRIGSSPECLEVIEEARQRLADQGYSMSHSGSYDDEGFQENEDSNDGDSWHEGSREEFPADHEGLPSASYNGEDIGESRLRESDHLDHRHGCYSGDSYLPGTFRPKTGNARDGGPREGDEHDDGYLLDRYLRDSRLHNSSLPQSHLREGNPPDSYSHCYERDDSSLSDSDLSYLRRGRDSTDASDDEEASCLTGPKKKDGQPDLRYKENRRIFCRSGTNKDGSPDMRMREHRREFSVPVNKNGTPDKRFKINKGLVGTVRQTSLSTSTTRPVKVHTVKNKGTPDMRSRNNRTALRGSSCVTRPACSEVGSTLSGRASSSRGPPLAVGPLKKDGTPDMRYTVNKQRFGVASAATSGSRGPLKRDGTPDMRYAVNRQSHPPPQLQLQARGPLKKDGTPDMRYKANRR